MGKDLKGKELGRGLTQRPDGRYMARAQVAGKSVLLYGWKLRTLKKEFAEAVEEARKGSIWLGYETDTLTLNEWFEEWYEKYKAPTLKNGGSAQYRRKFVNYYGVRIGSKNLKDIRQLHVQTAIADMLEAGRSSKSVREATGILQNCIEAAMANGLTSINPTVGVVIPKCDKVERRVLTVEEQEIFIEHLERTKSWYEEMYKLMLLTGMRIGEVGGLQWGDIDFTNRFISIKRSLSYQYEDGVKTIFFTSPKTENSVRKIPFFGETKDILMRQFEKQKAKRADMGKKWKQPKDMDDLIFTTSLGTPIGRYTIENDMRNITKQINETLRIEAEYSGTIPKKFERVHPHALRHTFATRCFEKGMTPRTVQEIMGHSNYNTTVSYTHVLDDIKLKEAERLGDFLDNTKAAQRAVQDELLGIM